MKITVIIVSIVFFFAFSSGAETHAQITNIHICCKSCVTGIEKAVGEVPGAKVEVDQDAGAVTLTGADAATVQKAADAMVAAGYFGKCRSEERRVGKEWRDRWGAVTRKK